MQEVKAIIRTERLADVVHALQAVPDMPGLTVSTVRGFGKRTPAARDSAPSFDETALSKLETVVSDALTPVVIDLIIAHANTGRPGDGKIFISPVVQLIQIRDNSRRGEGGLA